MTTSSLWVFWIGIYVIAIGVFYILIHMGGCCGRERPMVDPGPVPSPILAPSPRGSSG